MIKRLPVRMVAGAVGEFSSPELTLCTDSYSVSVPPPCHHSLQNGLLLQGGQTAHSLKPQPMQDWFANTRWSDSRLPQTSAHLCHLAPSEPPEDWVTITRWPDSRLPQTSSHS